MARLVDAGLRMALTRNEGDVEEWTSVIVSSGVEAGYRQKHEEFNAANVCDYLLRDPENGSSVLSSIETARTNARMVRTALTRETWESINDAWMSFRRMLAAPIDEREVPKVLDAIKRETAQIRGAFQGTMLRNEIYDFCQLGLYVERADNTARILDVKYYVLLPSISWVGSSMDNYQWESILRSVSAHRSYRWVYDAAYKPTNIAEFLILSRRMPRSLAFCYRMIHESLEGLANDYGNLHASHEMCENTLARMKRMTIKDVLDEGLHEYLTDFLVRTNNLGDQVARDYRFF